MQVLERLQAALDQAEEKVHAGEEVDSKGIESCCQDLVTWVKSKEAERQKDGTGGLLPSEMQRLSEIFDRLKEIGAILEEAQGEMDEKMVTMRRGRRAIGGYAFLKPHSKSRQYIDRKI